MRVHARALAQATAMKRKFMAADLNSDGMVDSTELKETKLLDSTARLEDFDIVTTHDKAGLDTYEFALLLSRHDELVQDQLHRQSGAGIRWSRAVSLGAATQIMLLGDENMDGKLSMKEALAAYGYNGQDFDMILRLGGRFMPLDAELYESDEDMEDEKQRQETQVKELLVPDIGKVMYGLMAALVGDKWADREYRKGFSVVEAVRLAVKFADYNNDGFVSRAESALLSIPPALFSALSPEGADGKQLSLDDILTALEDVSACDDVLVVDRPGEISLKTLYMPKGKCSLLIMPGWNLPASYAVSEGPTCPDKGSGEGSGSGAGKRRLLALGDSKTKTAPKSHLSFSPRYPASRVSRGAHQGGDKQPKGKFATRNLMRSVAAGHHKHLLVSTALSASDLNAKARKAKKHHHHDMEKRVRTAKTAESRRNQQLHQALKQLRSKHPAARARAIGPSRRDDMEQALATSLEHSALRVGKRGGRGRLGKQGMHAYRRIVKTNSGRATRVWQSLKGAVHSMRARMQRSREQGKGTQQQRGQGCGVRRHDARKSTKTKALRSRALTKARLMVKNKFRSPLAVRRLAAKAGDAVKRQATDGHGERKLLQHDTPAEPLDVLPVCTRWFGSYSFQEGEQHAGESTEGREGCLKLVMEKCPDAPLIAFRKSENEGAGSCYCRYVPCVDGRPFEDSAACYIDRSSNPDPASDQVCVITDVEWRVASGANPPATAKDLTGEEYVELFAMFPEILEETAASIEKAVQVHNEYLEKLNQATVSVEAFMEMMVQVGMPRELADMLVSLLSSRGTGMEETASDFGFVARVFNGCTLRGLAMNYSHEEYPGSKDGAQAPYCGLPWTVGQRVVQEMDSDGDGVISPHETCISPADFAKAAGFRKRWIGASDETDGLSEESSAAPVGSSAAEASECPNLPVFNVPMDVYYDDAQNARVRNGDVSGLCHSNPACEVAMHIVNVDYVHCDTPECFFTLDEMGVEWNASLQLSPNCL